MVNDHNPDSPHGLQIGELAPDFTVSDVFGNEINLRTLYSDHPVLLNFFRGHY